MKKNRTIAALILLMVMVMSILSGCGKKEPEPEPTPEPEPVDTSIVFTDMAGREVKLEKPAEKIVALDTVRHRRGKYPGGTR